MTEHSSARVPDHRHEYDLAARAAERLRDAGFGNAVAAIQTGSGIPVPALRAATTLSWDEIPGMPTASAPGHRGAIHHGLLGDDGPPVLVLEGRLHHYEGHAPAAIVRPVRAVGLLGVRRLILTNATGGVREGWAAGTIVRIVDHVNLLGFDPLRGLHDPRFGERFPVTVGRAHDPELGRLVEEVARDLGVPLRQGVYGAVHGPSFETAAEVRRLRMLGIDVVGMSTVPELLAANQLGLRTLVLSLVANPAGEVTEGASAEEEVLAVAGRTGHDVVRLIDGLVRRLGE